MAKHVSVHFKFKGRLYSVTLKTKVEDISLAMMEERLYKKLELDESKVKLLLGYRLLLVDCEDQLTICDDEDLFVYLTSIDRENRRCVLLVEEISRPDQIEKLSRVGISSIGMNYMVEGNGVEVGPNAITLYVEDGQTNAQKEVIEAENDDDYRRGDDCMETDTAPETDTAAETGTAAETDTVGETDTFAETDTGVDMGDKYVEQPPVEKSSQVIEKWEDGLGLSKLQEFPCKKSIQEIVDRAAYVECFRYITEKSDRRRLVVKCCVGSCKWGLRAARIPNTEMFSIRRYTGVHTCCRTSQSKISKSKRRGSAELVATYLNEQYPGKVRTPVPKDIMELLKLNLGVKISYSTALRGKNLAISHLRGNSEDCYRMLPSYLYMLEQVNPETKTSLK